MMKNISIVLVMILLASCSSKHSSSENATAKDSLSVPVDINMVVGIGKVEPENGVVNLASNVGGIVQSVEQQAGDSVIKGAVIVILNQSDAAMKVQQLKDQIATQRQQVQSDQIAVGQYHAQLQDKINTLATSEKLAKTGAETRQNVASLKTDKKVLQVQLNKSRKAVSVSRSKIKELQSQLKSGENTLGEKTIKAPSDGVLLSLDAKEGGAIQPLESFATFAPKGPLVVHGEADEMFANKLAIGLQVTIHYIGNAHTVTTGKIIYLSPELSNKSLFTDVPGEQQDRRVRRFKVLLDSTDHLLINTKVACNIHLKSSQP